MAYAFSTGMVVYNSLEVYRVSEVSLENTNEEIPLIGNLAAPIAIAAGKGKVTGSIKSANFDLEFVKTITNYVMAPNSSEVPWVWYVADTTGTKHSFTMPNVTITGLKLGSGNDKWLTSDISFEAAAAASGDQVIIKGTTANFPTITPVDNIYIFGSGSLTRGSDVVGTLSEIAVDISWQSIPLYGNKTYPVAVARGPISCKITAKSGEIDPLFFPNVTSTVMAPNSGETALVWDVEDSAGDPHTLTFPNVTMTSRKLGTGNDKWLTNDLAFSAAASSVDQNILEVT